MVEKLKRFITGKDVETEAGESESLFQKDPMTKLGSMFRFFSVKENGVISKPLLESGLNAYGVYLSNVEIEEVFERMDTGGNGEVDYKT